MTAEDMEASMMHKDNRHLEILTVKDVVEAGESLRMLMGTDVEGRREFLFENVDFSKLNG
jgi:DNA gyrase/topoisomerase IV subunit B